MNILMVHPHEVYSSLEPWTTRVINLARVLAAGGHAVKVIYFPFLWNAKLKSFTRDGVEFLPFSRRTGIYNIAFNCNKFSSIVKWADIVHFQKCFHYASLPAILNGMLKNKPLHYDWDDWEEMIYYESARPAIRGVGSFLRTLEKNIPTLVDTISVSSECLRGLCLEMGLDEERVFTVPVGADLDKFSPSVSGDRIRKMYNINRPLAMYIGQLHGGQYASLFIHAAKILIEKGVEADFMIVGDGSRGYELRKLTRMLKLDRKIIFTGAVDTDLMPEYIASSDVAVACFEDNLVTRCKSPLKIAEYLACGKAIVASRVGEVEKMVGDAGILVDPGQSKPLAEGILSLLIDDRLRIKLGEKARTRAEEVYNWKNSANTLLKAYEFGRKQKSNA